MVFSAYKSDIFPLHPIEDTGRRGMDIHQIVHYFYRAKEIIKKVYNKIMNLI